MSFSDDLVAANRAAWQRATKHRFTAELGADTLPDAVYRRYLLQDYAFIDTLASLVGYGVAKAPDMAAKALLAGFLAALTSEENTYFERSFEALGVAADERRAVALWPVSQAFLDEMRDAGETGGYADIVAVLLAAESVYLAWGKDEAGNAPSRFYLREWIELHANPAFEAFVSGLKRALDRAADRLAAGERERVAGRFARMLELEAAFFDAAYDMT